MNLTIEDERLLKELCEQHNISYEKVVKPLQTVREHDFTDRRFGIYEALSEIIKTNLSK